MRVLSEDTDEINSKIETESGLGAAEDM